MHMDSIAHSAVESNWMLVVHICQTEDINNSFGVIVHPPIIVEMTQCRKNGNSCSEVDSNRLLYLMYISEEDFVAEMSTVDWLLRRTQSTLIPLVSSLVLCPFSWNINLSCLPPLREGRLCQTALVVAS